MWLDVRVFVKRALARARTAALGPHVEGVLCRAGPHRFVLPASDFTIGRKIAFFGAYNEEELDALSRLIREHEVREVAFVGSHVGYFVVKVAELVDSVDAIEPNPPTADLLELNLNLNGCRNVRVHRMAATSAPCELDFVAVDENSGSSHVLRGPARRPGMLKVKGDTVDSLGLSPGLVVVDTEGHEVAVLRGMAATLPKVRAISCELIPALLDAAGNTVAEQIGLLAPHFDVFHVDSLDSARLTAEEVCAWFEGLSGDARRVSRNVLAYKAA